MCCHNRQPRALLLIVSGKQKKRSCLQTTSLSSPTVLNDRYTPSSQSSFADQADIQRLHSGAATGPEVRYMLSWRDIYYEVPDKASGGAKRILCGVSGHVAPGEAPN